MPPSSQTPNRHTPVPLPNPSGYGYYEYLPPGYGTGTGTGTGTSTSTSTSTGTRFPLIVFFHGSGERGDGSLEELPRVLRHGPPKLIESGEAFPAIVISPQTASRWPPSMTTPFIDYLMRHYDADPDRIYITGLSLGGEGAWLYAQCNSGIPAALVPICGPHNPHTPANPDNGTKYGVLRDLPTWVFHALGDAIVPISDTQDILADLTGVRPIVVGNGGKTGYFTGAGAAWSWRPGQAAPATGENPTFTIYSGAEHDAWTAAYGYRAMWDWMFAQRRPGARHVF